MDGNLNGRLSQAPWIVSGDISYQQNSFNEIERGMQFNFRSRVGMIISENWYLGIHGGFLSYRAISPGKPGLATYFVPSTGGSILIHKNYHGTEANQLISIGPQIQRFIPLSEKTFIHLSASLDYQQGRGTFTPEMFIPSIWMGGASLASSYILPEDRSFRERNYGAHMQIGLSHFFFNKVALDLNAGLLNWQSINIEDSQAVSQFFDPIITRSESAFKILPNPLAMRLGLIVLL